MMNKYNKHMDDQKPSAGSVEALYEIKYKKRKNSNFNKLIKFAAAAACIIIVFSLGAPTLNILKNYDVAEITAGLYAPEAIEPFQELKNYDEMKNLIKNAVSNKKNDKYYNTDYAVEAYEMEEPANAGNDGNIDYSDTNNQVAGVTEADIIKTDGKYIYSISNNRLIITALNEGELENTSVIDVEDNKNYGFVEMYLLKDRLIIIKILYEQRYEDGGVYYGWSGFCGTGLINAVYKTYADIIDITDRSEPKLINTLGQSGYYHSSRMIGDRLYLITNQNTAYFNENDYSSYIPEIFEGEKKTFVGVKNIMINPACFLGDTAFYNLNYTIISGMDTSGAGAVSDTKAIAGYSGNIYCSLDNLYIASSGRIETDEYSCYATEIIKFNLGNDRIEITAQGKVPGNVLNQFSMDEYKGNFRLVTNVNMYSYKTKSGQRITNNGARRYNNLYILDEDLAVKGEITELAENERIYSVRFDGETGYFVTFRQVDPLFAVDLSNPGNPVLLSELKIPGFSEYLHVYGDGLLFGLGKDADENTGSIGTLKLSMFDTSDPADVTEKHKFIFKDEYYSKASYNHKAILINSGKDLITFCAEGKYYIFGYDSEDGFYEKASIYLDKYDEARGIYINDYFYIISDHEISSYDMNDSFKLKDKIYTSQ